MAHQILHIENIFNILHFVTINFIILYLTGIILCAIHFFWIQCLEHYWFYKSEDAFCEKLREIIIDVNPDIVVFSNRNLLYKLSYIYKNMKKIEKQTFLKQIYNNGLVKRVEKYINIY